jgi:hypothetical protein
LENKKAAILVLALVAAVVVTASGIYAMGARTTGQGYAGPITGIRSGMGPSMMSGSFGRAGGMMGGYGMMGYGQSSMQDMRESMWHYWNFTAAP